jgi:hypothetical protein
MKPVRANCAAAVSPKVVVDAITFASCRLTGEPFGRPLRTDEG